MIWRNPWAWLGLLSLVVPVLIHLLTRRTARVQRFPTLRFLDTSKQAPARRLRLRDLLLLAVRILILAAAVAALAQPYFITAARTGRTANVPSRVVIVDTSASMQRATATGEPAVAAARAVAAQIMNDEPGTSTILETSLPSLALPGAVAWLETQPGTHAIVIVSDFQAGSVVETAITSIPASVGIRFQRIEPVPDTVQPTVTVQHGTVESVVRVTHRSERTDAEWVTRPATASPGALQLIAAASDNHRANAGLAAALAVGAPFASDTTRGVVIVFSGAPRHDQLVQIAQPVNRPWMGDVMARLVDDAVIDRAARAIIDQREHLLLFTRAEPGSLPAAQLIHDVLRALNPAQNTAELETEVLSAETLAAWTRPPQDTRAPDPDASDGRWFWLLVLALLGVETWLRRRSARAAAT